MGLAVLGWVAGCLTIWSSLFAIGYFLYGRTQLALVLTAVLIVSSGVLLFVCNRLWDRDTTRDEQGH
jgi:multisubunit Na+/H+ antiporter MnhC subunit